MTQWYVCLTLNLYKASFKQKSSTKSQFFLFFSLNDSFTYKIDFMAHDQQCMPEIQNQASYVNNWP